MVILCNVMFTIPLIFVLVVTYFGVMTPKFLRTSSHRKPCWRWFSDLGREDFLHI